MNPRKWADPRCHGSAHNQEEKKLLAGSHAACGAAEHHQIGHGIAAQAVFTVNAARDFPRSVEAGNDLAVLVEYLGLRVDADAAHRVVDGRNLLGEIPGAFGHRTVVRVVGLKAELVLRNFVTGNAVVLFDRSTQTVDVDLDHLGEFFKIFGLLDATLFEHVLHLATAQKVDRVFVRVAQVVLHQPVGLVGLRKDGLGEHVAGCAFVNETVAQLIEEEAVTARSLDVEHQTRARCAVRVHLNVGKPNEIGLDLFGHDEAFTLSGNADVRAPDRFVEVGFLPDACVHLLAILDVCAKAARRDDDALGSHHTDLLAVVLGFDAYDAAVLLDKAECLGVKKHLNLIGVLLEGLFKRADVGVAARGIGVVRALIESARGCAHLGIDDEPHAFKPTEGVLGIVRKVMHEVRDRWCCGRPSSSARNASGDCPECPEPFDSACRKR